MNRKGSNEEEELKFKPHAAKELPLRGQGRSMPRKDLQVQKAYSRASLFVRGTSREPTWLESKERRFYNVAGKLPKATASLPEQATI